MECAKLHHPFFVDPGTAPEIHLQNEAYVERQSLGSNGTARPGVWPIGTNLTIRLLEGQRQPSCHTSTDQYHPNYRNGGLFPKRNRPHVA